MCVFFKSSTHSKLSLGQRACNLALSLNKSSSRIFKNSKTSVTLAIDSIWMWLPVPQVKIDRRISGIFRIRWIEQRTWRQQDQVQDIGEKKSGCHSIYVLVGFWKESSSIPLIPPESLLLIYNELNIISSIKRRLTWSKSNSPFVSFV